MRLRSSSFSCSSELSERKTKAVDTRFLSLRYRCILGEIRWRDEMNSGGFRWRTRLNSPRLAHSPPKPTVTPKTTEGNLDLFIGLGSKKRAKFFQTSGTFVLFLRSYSFQLCCFGNQFSMIKFTIETLWWNWDVNTHKNYWSLLAGHCYRGLLIQPIAHRHWRAKN